MGRSFIRCLKRIFSMTASGTGPAESNSPMTEKAETCVLQPAHTIRLKPDPETGREHGVCTEAETSIAWCGLTDTGRVRTHNEDYFVCTDLREGTLFIVADGMGGHDAGEVASMLAVETAASEVRKAGGTHRNASKVVEQAVQRANSEVIRRGAEKASNMGTTLTLALILEDKAYIANVGDSRAYWIENGSFKRITVDHSLVEKLVSLGKLTPEEARKHPKSNVLYRNVGSEEDLKVDVFQVALKKGGSLLLCTDGLWGEVVDRDIHRAVTEEDDVRKVCERLIRMANENGGKDNITTVAVKVI